MEFRFDANQEFQIEAIEAVAGLFEGQACLAAHVRFQEGSLNLAAIANRLDVDETRMLANLQAVQRRNRIRPDGKLEYIEGVVNANGGLLPRTVKAMKLKKDDLFICRDVALTDELAANLALQCKVKTI